MRYGNPTNGFDQIVHAVFEPITSFLFHMDSDKENNFRIYHGKMMYIKPQSKKQP